MRASRLVAVFALLSALIVPALAVRAQDAGPAFAEIASDNFNRIEAGILALAGSGAPTAAPTLEALADGRLFFTPARDLFRKDKAGALFDARTGAAVAEAPGGMKPVRVNNRIRRATDAALGTLTLMSPDPAKRRAAAEAVFKSRDAAALPALEAALAKEQDATIRKLLARARAAVVVADASAPEGARVAAVEVLAERGDQDVLALFNTVKADAPPALKTTVEAGAAAIERRMQLLEGVQNAWYGLSLGSVLLLAAIGLAITFGVMGIINMAHGEMVMIGAYTTFVVQEVIRTRFPSLFDWSLAIAVPLAFLTAGAVGLLLERTVIRFLYGRPLETLLATWGVSLILQQAVRSIFGPNNREVGAPAFMSGSTEVLGVSITYGRLWIVVFGLIVFATLFTVLRATSFGLKMRAVTQNRKMAASMGIRTPWVDALTFALGSGIAGIAGVALSQIDNVSPNLGQSYIIDSFMVVVFGGVGNLWGTLFAAMSLGIANKFLEPFAGAVLGKILVLVFIILFIQKRPRGLFALKGRAVEA